LNSTIEHVKPPFRKPGLSDKTQSKSIPDLSCEDRFATSFNPVSRLFTRLERLNLDRKAAGFAAQLKPVKAMPDCLKTGIAVIAVVKNEIGWLRHFLQHYRDLGVSGFVIIDNGSTDGTCEHAIGEPDCHVMLADASYAAAGFGSRWISAAVDMCGLRNRWLITADADELLVYDGCEKHSISALARWLESRSLASLPSLMLDVYSSEGKTVSKDSSACLVADRRVMFDMHGYGRSPSMMDRLLLHKALWIDGGPRARKMFADGKPRKIAPYLHKVPFMRWSAGATLKNSHEADPVELNFSPVRGALLHLKLLDLDRLKDPARLEALEHWNNGAQYKVYHEQLDSDPGMKFTCEQSGYYDGSHSLAECGLVSRLDWSE
jgi:hypothetical protein